MVAFRSKAASLAELAPSRSPLARQARTFTWSGNATDEINPMMSFEDQHDRGQKVIVKEGQARLESGNLAGSVLGFQEAFRNIIAFTGCSILDAVKMSSVNQAREFGLVRKGGIAPGKDADMVLLSETFTVERTISFGKIVFNKNRK